MRILGIDPGSQVTGYGIVERVSSAELRHVAHGTLRLTRTAGASARLALLHQGLVDVVATHSPDVAVVERVFVSASPRSALVLGQARGVALAALGAAAIPVSELDTREVKQAVVGTGAATKAQVQAMVVRLLSLERRPAADAADALAVAICHAHRARLAELVPRKGRGRRRGSGTRSSRGGRFVVRRAR